MEHVNANQVSPTLLPGDKSMLSIAIHEITHSWFGNDVGCKNWNHFWINEGMNVFMERKVLEGFYGLDYIKIDYYTGNTTMYQQMVDWYGLDNSYSSLFPDIGDDDPENSFSRVPYDKGSQFMYYIETLLGPEATQAYLRDYIYQFHGMAIDSPEHKNFYEEWVTTNMAENATLILDNTMWDTWIYEPGVAPVPLDFFSEAVERGQNLAREYLTLATVNETATEVSRGFSSPLNYEEYLGYYGSQKVAFIQELSRLGDDVGPALLAHIDSDLNISLGEINPDARNEWYTLGIQRGYDAVMKPAYEWTGSQGRSAYVRPVFSALIEAGNCEAAVNWCEDFCSSYNVYVSSRVQISIEEGCSTGGEDAEGDGGGGTEANKNETDGTGGEVDGASQGGSGQLCLVAYSVLNLVVLSSGILVMWW
jgi:leukotriene-A4 hydrolase